MAAGKLTDVLTHGEVDLLRRTMSHFFRDPDFATGEETGRSFATLEFGQALPLELVIRDWRTELNDGTGGRDYRNGDCYRIYMKLYEEGGIATDDIDLLLSNIWKDQ